MRRVIYPFAIDTRASCGLCYLPLREETEDGLCAKCREEEERKKRPPPPSPK